MKRDKLFGMQRKVRNIHFVGIGGIGMSGIAEVLLNLGYQVSGSDLSASDITRRLAQLGAKIMVGHDADHIGNADVVVVSSAVKGDNPEVLEAHGRNIPVIPRAEMLAELLKMKFSIAVSGSHGKTTTTSMIATVLASGGLDPTMVIGGRLGSIGSNARLGDGEVIVAEADESDGSFLKLSPTIAVITNIDLEHLDHYRDLEEIKSAFLAFANSIPFYGATVLCGDDANIRSILPEIKRRAITYGLGEQVELRAKDIESVGRKTRFSVCLRDSCLGTVEIPIPGIFNVLNALATVAVGRELDLPFSAIQRGLKEFTGVHRRLEVKGVCKGITVIDDYGHHPTEIRATLEALKNAWPGRRIVIFQPHRYSRTKALFDDFLISFSDADLLIVTDIYPAGETPLMGISAPLLVEGIRGKGKQEVIYRANFEDIVDFLLREAKGGDVILTLGAGNVWKVGDMFLAQCR